MTGQEVSCGNCAGEITDGVFEMDGQSTDYFCNEWCMGMAAGKKNPKPKMKCCNCGLVVRREYRSLCPACYDGFYEIVPEPAQVS